MEYHPICLIIPTQTSFMQITMGEAWKAGWHRELVAQQGAWITRRSLGASQAPCEWDPGFLPRGVSLILTFGAAFSASVIQAAEPL